MKTIISSNELNDKRKFQIYLELVEKLMVPSECKNIGEGEFYAHIESAKFGKSTVSRCSFNKQSVRTTPQTIRRHDKQDFLSIIMRVSGTAASSQYDRSIIQRPGDIVLFDSAKPLEFEYAGATRSVFIELPRRPIEAMLGSAALFAGLPILGQTPSAKMAHGFFNRLLRVEDALTADMAERLMGIGTDLLVASLAERIAVEPPASIQGTIIVQRAKAYADRHIADADLKSSDIAAAAGVSLRHLQHLFAENGLTVADWLWNRRLERAARQLADPNLRNQSITSLAHASGFSSSSHFTRRFRDQFDLSPSDYRAKMFGHQN